MTKISVLGKVRRARKPVLVKKPVSKEEFIDLLETVESYINHLQTSRGYNLKKSIQIIQEMKFSGIFDLPSSRAFRQETFDELKDFADDLYVEIHT
jgi:hypothetical protein